MLKYALILQDQVMLTVNVSAVSLNLIYCVFYFLYSTNKWVEFLKPLSIAMGFVAILWGYTEVEDPALVEFRYGVIVTVLMLFLMGNPLLGIVSIKGGFEKQV